MNKTTTPQKPFFYDMAAEASAALRGRKNTEIPGVAEEVSENELYRKTVITILNEEGAEVMGRPCGSYITVDSKIPITETDPVKLIETLSEQLGSILPPKTDKPILICGIGNPTIASDALGEKTIAAMFPTRHIFSKADPEKKDFDSTALFCPNVLGNTGMESAELVRGICREIHPRAVIAIDALSTSAIKRLGASFQLTDTGLTPGGGVNNTRPVINAGTLGVPVIAIGVPTVLYPQSLIADAFDTLWDYLAEHEKTAVSHLRDTAESYLFQRMQDHFTLGVTPKDIDCIADQLSQILAGSIQAALHPGITAENYEEYIYL